MKHIRPMVYEYEDGRWKVLYPVQPAGSEAETFKSVGLYDQRTRLIALVPLLSQDAPDTVSELITVINAYDAHVARIAELEARVEALTEVCKVAYDAIESLPIDSFGQGQDGQLVWPIRDEVLHNIAVAIAQVRGAAGE